MKTILLFLLALCMCFCGACGHSPERDVPPAPPPPEKLYSEAIELYKKSNYIDGYDAFQKCRTRYPISEWGIKAELKMADCLYYQKEYDTAFIQYQKFTQLHPTYQYIDYVYYQMGMCFYNQLCTIDRDQTFAHEGVKHFERLLSLFPSSLYTPSAMEKLNECKKNIAEHILYIGNFYYKTGSYHSALFRYQEALHDYYGYLSSPDLLVFQLGKTYLRLEEPENAREQFVVLLSKFPESPYASLCEILLEDSKQIEELDKIKISQIVKKANILNPVRAIRSIPLPFVGKDEKED